MISNQSTRWRRKKCSRGVLANMWLNIQIRVKRPALWKKPRYLRTSKKYRILTWKKSNQASPARTRKQVRKVMAQTRATLVQGTTRMLAMVSMAIYNFTHWRSSWKSRPGITYRFVFVNCLNWYVMPWSAKTSTRGSVSLLSMSASSKCNIYVRDSTNASSHWSKRWRNVLITSWNERMRAVEK